MGVPWLYRQMVGDKRTNYESRNAEEILKAGGGSAEASYRSRLLCLLLRTQQGGATLSQRCIPYPDMQEKGVNPLHGFKGGQVIPGYNAGLALPWQSAHTALCRCPNCQVTDLLALFTF